MRSVMAATHWEAPQQRDSSAQASAGPISFRRVNASMDPQAAHPPVREDLEAHVAEGAAGPDLPAEEVTLVRAELRARQDLLPARVVAGQRREGCRLVPAALQGGALR